MVLWKSLLVGSLFVLACASAGPALGAESRVDFRADVFPLLRDRCFRCHEGRNASSGHRLDLRDEWIGRTNADPVAIAGNSQRSRVIALVTGVNPKTVMPPEGPRLSDREVTILKQWVDAGLPWDAALLPEQDDGAAHWAFQPVARPTIPLQNDSTWPRTPIDPFVASRHRQLKISPEPEADRRTLVRRLYFDLLGLPPTWEETQEFLADQRPDAVECLVDRLLASPHHGEHWGRHWLDVARWAESEGFESNHPRPFAWRYRDLVVRAIREDWPFDEFLRMQIAGDEFPEYSDDHLIATGFLAAARISSNEEDKWLQQNDVTVDIVNAVGGAFLGLTLHCAQCHDHKFDPISIQDYYSLHAYFARGIPVNVRLRDPQVLREDAAVRSAEFEQAVNLKRLLFDKAKRQLVAVLLSQLETQDQNAIQTPVDLRTVDQELIARRASLKLQKAIGEIERSMSDADRKLYDELKKYVSEQEKVTPPFPQTFAYYSPVTSPHRLDVLPSIGFYPLPYEPDELARRRTYVMNRGEVHQIGPSVSPRVPMVLDRPATRSDGTSRSTVATRLGLADWMTDRQHPLVSRVWVNRIWQHHMGRGIVSTPDDFGVRGDRPSHPELLDWLSAELMEHDWSSRHIHRLIVTSAIYRQGTRHSDQANEVDRENRFLTGYPVRRMRVEVLHDALLAATGRLNPSIGGASIPVDGREHSSRRNLYLVQRRGHPTEMQRLFDGPNECAATTGSRYVSTSPLQSLYLLNSAFIYDCARHLCNSIRQQGLTNRRDLVVQLFQCILLRHPTSVEMQAAEKLWDSGESEPLELVCVGLLNLNEFVYVD